MDQQLLNNIIQAVVLVIAAVASYLLRNLTKIKAATKDNQVAQSTVDVVSKIANYAVHELESGDLDNKAKRTAAINLVTSTLSNLGMPSIPDKVISGAVEAAVSAMHLAWNQADTAAPEDTDVKAPSTNTMGQPLFYDPQSQLATDADGATYTVTRLGSKDAKPIADSAKTDSQEPQLYSAD